MKEFIGKEVTVQHMLGIKIKCVLLDVLPDSLKISQEDKDGNKFIAYIPKEQVGMVMCKDVEEPIEEPNNDSKEEPKTEEEPSLVKQNSGLLVLSLVDKKTHKPSGQYYITDGGDVQENVDLFIKTLEVSSDDYAVTVLGDLFEVDHSLLRHILSSLILDTTGE